MPTNSDTSQVPRIAVSVAARDSGTGRFLLVFRANPPAQNLWAFPGGRVHFGETLADAAARELMEETGLEARDVRLHTVLELIDADAGDPSHFVLAVHVAEVAGEPVAADDAADARWVSVEEMEALPITGTTLAIVHEIADRGA